MSDINLDVRVYPIEEPKGTTLAFASVSIDDLVAIRGIRVVDGEKGLFVSMPQSQDGKGEYHDVAFPLNADLRKDITDRILDEYEYALESAEHGQNRDNRDNRNGRNDRNDRNDRNGRNGNDRNNNRQQGSGQRRNMGDRMRNGKEKADNYNNSQRRQPAAKSRDSGSR